MKRTHIKPYPGSSTHMRRIRIFSLGNDSPFFAETIGLPYFSARCREILKPCFGNWRGGMVSS